MSKFKKYYANPELREYYLAQKRKQMKCPGCDRIISRNNYNTHLKSNVHKINSKKNQETIMLEQKRISIEKFYDRKIREVTKLKKRKLKEIIAED